jgi:hypothetical protein
MKTIIYLSNRDQDSSDIWTRLAPDDGAVWLGTAWFTYVCLWAPTIYICSRTKGQTVD